MSSSDVMAGSAMRARTPATSSCKLCGGILVAMPTAMPSAPFISRLGSLAGRTLGSTCGGAARETRGKRAKLARPRGTKQGERAVATIGTHATPSRQGKIVAPKLPCAAARTVDESKLGIKSTVPAARSSSSIALATAASRHSVYLPAAGQGFSP